ncbi:DUF2157 domain-containing protein [Flavihumibacter sp. ZG627]|uniref:DUF2157 domain-containing protein n=1 Tax=Flavihumibacter sp. ZG627 TaxID=1463156 RepID=UPI00057F3904|nr:DUF2157 domain-containing protein [Flavihumibacter sp. ZG627]
MALAFFEALYTRSMLSEASIEKIRQFYKYQKTSVRLEIQVLLYLGVLLVSGGTGVLIYKYIDQIGHLAIISGLLLATIGCYTWCFLHKEKQSAGEGESDKESSPVFDYVLMLGAILLVTLVGYLQSQFQLFGSRWSLATFIPMVLLFATAYYFDHRGVLALAVTNLATWLGLTINASSVFGLAELDSNRTIITALGLGVFLTGLSWVVKRSDIRPHFEGTYHQFGSHFFFISSIAAMLNFERTWPLFFILLLAGAWYHYLKAMRDRSFYYMVVMVLYTYITITIVFIDKVLSLLDRGPNTVYITLFYFIGTGIGLTTLLISLNKKLRHHDSLSHS